MTFAFEVIMKIYAPKYYENFKCIAEKCNHSCCIGWGIDLDKVTLEKYTSLLNCYGEMIRNTISFDNTPCFKLDEHKCCPHLNCKGLCNIIINCGEEYISDICREHPRFYNYTNKGKELGIGLSCEAACSIILSSDNFDQIVEIGNDTDEILECSFNALEYRDIIFRMLKNDSMLICEKVDMIYDYFDVFLYKFYFPEVTSKLEYLYEENRLLISKAEVLEWNDDISEELTRILGYFVYRHSSDACDFYDFFASLSFAIFCTGLISTLATKENIENIARIVSEEIEYSQENTDYIKSLFITEIDGEFNENY